MEDKNQNQENEDRINQILIPKSDIKSFNIFYDACKSTCKIITSSGIGSGFFINLEKNNSSFYCLMTNEHVIEKKMIDSKEDIEILYENQHKKININLGDKKRFIKDYKYLKIDVTVVEILPQDDIKNDYFLLPNLDYINSYEQFINKNIYIPQFPKGGILTYSKGKIIEINSFSYEICHTSSTEKGSSGSPILLEGTTLVLGIHKQGNKKKIKNFGNFIGPIINSLKNNCIYEKKKYNNGIYEGEYINELREGFGNFLYNDGHYYEGQWKNDIPNGKGALYLKNENNILIKIYEGDFVNEEFEGKGKYICKNGDYYIGNFVKNKFEGEGEYFYKNGDKYKGTFMDGYQNGKGIYYKKGIIEYEGDFIKGEYEGQGRLNFPNGNYYVGHINKGKMNGYGKLYNENKKLIYKGNFINEIYDGEGELHYSNGSYYIGPFINGKRNGEGKLMKMEI